MNKSEIYQPKHHLRMITAASLFDGHDASINIMRRIMQKSGCEVIHLGHNRSVQEIVKAAIEEDVQGIAVTSYQGGHNEYFRYMIDELKRRDYGHIKVFGGGGGVILPDEIAALQDYGVTRLYSPEDGRRMGLQGMINDMIKLCDFDPVSLRQDQFTGDKRFSNEHLLRLMTSSANHNGGVTEYLKRPLNEALILGITGTGGAGKSSLCDEIILRLRARFPERKILIICVDPTIRKSGGSLLGDRIRMNSIHHKNIVLRSLATRQDGQELAQIREAVELGKRGDFDLILLETPGIGQGDTSIVDIADISLYVMTSEFGAPSQLEKIGMLDYADIVAINKFERLGSADAYREVCRALRRNRNEPSSKSPEELPVFGTSASHFNDTGINALVDHLINELDEKDKHRDWRHVSSESPRFNDSIITVVPPHRIRYLSEISEAIHKYKSWALEQSNYISQLNHLKISQTLVQDPGAEKTLEESAEKIISKIDAEVFKLYEGLEAFKEKWQGDDYVYEVRGKEIHQKLKSETLSGLKVSRVAFPTYWDPGRMILWRLSENMPGEFPYTSGLFPLKRQGEDPARMFAGEGNPARTNKRFHLLSQGLESNRLSTAFDSVTLYGEDPADEPDVYGKVGESGVSICSVENMERLYAGFDLCCPKTSVSMTINGPAPVILAFFMNTAIRQQCRVFLIEEGRLKIEKDQAFHPESDGVFWQDRRKLLSDEEYQSISDATVRLVRGTVQADILKEDQAQNTCILSTEFALRLMADIQEWFIDHKIKNYYSVSISGYHIAEAGANPISQLAFTLANGFTFVEKYLSRGMKIDDFAPNLSFFFSNGLDPEYQVIGRVARRIWALAIKNLYGGNESSQKLKYHIQTSGRSLHAQEIDFNDIRTTLQALIAIYDNCNSLHTNAYDEAITTPTDDSVRRALAIQMIINKEFGGAKNENPLQGSFIIEELTDLVEEAVLEEFDRLTARGGVLGAMETQYQRSRIQEESLLYESLKHSGELPIVGVNTFINEKGGMASDGKMEVARASVEEKEGQLAHVKEFQARHKDQAEAARQRLTDAANNRSNLFDVLMSVSNQLTLGQITHTLYLSGGKYRRNI
jgi:methylmalonyl-CoA mutase